MNASTSTTKGIHKTSIGDLINQLRDNISQKKSGEGELTVKKGETANTWDNVINLSREDDDIFFIGEDNGKRIGRQIINASFKKDKKNIIKIDNSIEDVTISFVEGIISSLPRGVTCENFYKYFTIEGNDVVVDKFRNVIMNNFDLVKGNRKKDES